MPTSLAPKDEERFRAWFSLLSHIYGYAPDPDEPEHYYDYRAAWRDGVRAPVPTEGFAEPHWDSKYKDPGHPHRFVDGVDTISGERLRPIAESVYGYGVRNPTESEIAFFFKNKGTAGMAAEDGKIVLNPYSTLSDEEKMSVAVNEAARLFMREEGIDPGVDLTEKQRLSLRGTAYEGDDVAARQTVLGRILSGDPSALDVTEEQRAMAEDIRRRLRERGRGLNPRNTGGKK